MLLLELVFIIARGGVTYVIIKDSTAHRMGEHKIFSFLARISLKNSVLIVRAF